MLAWRRGCGTCQPMSQGCRGIPRLSMGPRGRHPARDEHARSLPTSGPHSETHVAPLYRLLACSRAVLVPSASIRIPSSCIASCQTLHSFFPRESASLASSRLIPAAPGCCQRGMPHHSLQAITTLEPVLVNIFLELSSCAASCSHTSKGPPQVSGAGCSISCSARSCTTLTSTASQDLHPTRVPTVPPLSQGHADAVLGRSQD